MDVSNRPLLTALLLLFFTQTVFAQTYDSYFIGDTTDVTTTTSQGICLMGGASEHDEAMKWFLNKSGGGDILVIRVSGSDGYQNYLYTTLGVAVNSVQTIVFNDTAAANDPYVIQQIENAEAIWMAGGDQFDYISLWKGTPIETALNNHVLVKQAPIGGTSAGMAILGNAYFTGQYSSVLSQAALDNPFSLNITIDYDDFLSMPFLDSVITDTHYDDPDRRGRHITFLARMVQEQGKRFCGIACDEYTAICIDQDGIARAYGEYPAHDDNIYFLQANCVSPIGPEICQDQTPLTWNRNQEAVKVYHIQGDLNGTKYLDLNDWKTGVGGEWEDWYVEQCELFTQDGDAPECWQVGISEVENSEIPVWYPNPTSGQLSISTSEEIKIEVYNSLGECCVLIQPKEGGTTIDLSGLGKGMYLIRTTTPEEVYKQKVLLE